MVLIFNSLSTFKNNRMLLQSKIDFYHHKIQKFFYKRDQFFQSTLISKQNQRIQTLFQLLLKMGKKAQKDVQKKGNKKQQTKKVDEPAQEPVTKGRKQKEAHKSQASGQLQLFPNEIQSKYEEFSNLYRQINKSNEEGQKSDSFDLEDKKQKLANRIRESCLQLFKEELKSAGDWIQDTQKSIKTQIERLESSYDKVREILNDTGALQPEQITSALEILQNKVEQKKQDLKRYEDLQVRRKNIYE